MTMHTEDLPVYVETVEAVALAAAPDEAEDGAEQAALQDLSGEPDPEPRCVITVTRDGKPVPCGAGLPCLPHSVWISTWRAGIDYHPLDTDPDNPGHTMCGRPIHHGQVIPAGPVTGGWSTVSLPRGAMLCKQCAATIRARQEWSAGSEPAQEDVDAATAAAPTKTEPAASGRYRRDPALDPAVADSKTPWATRTWARGELRDSVLAYLTARPGEWLTPTQVAQGIRAHVGPVLACCQRAVKAGRLEQSTSPPVAFRTL